MALTYIKASGLDSSVASQLASTPKISTITYPGIETATTTAGGETITLTGQGFASGVTVLIGTTPASVVTFTSSTSISFTAPALSAGSYILYVINTDGGTGIAVPGLQYSGTPSWTTSAGSLGSVYETASFTQSLSATGDAPITFALASGTLPPGATLNSNGTITGTSDVGSGSQTTYTFSINALDAQNQPTARTFTITINPDVVTWVTPIPNATINLDGSSYSQALTATSAAGQTVSYTANALPTGLSLSAGTISGIPTVEGTTTTLLTGTAANSTRTGTNTITWIVIIGDSYWQQLGLLLSSDTTLQTKNFIYDSSNSSSQLAIYGDTKPQRMHPYQGPNYSYGFNGNGFVSYGASSNYLIGTDNMTIEAWIYPTSVVDNISIAASHQSGGMFQFMLSGGRLYIGFNTDGGASSGYTGLTGTSTSVVLNTWQHVAAVRNGTTVKVYVNGVADSTTLTLAANTNIGSYSGNKPIYIGGGADQGTKFIGLISNFRYALEAIYTTNFTPSTSPLGLTTYTKILTAQNNRFMNSMGAPGATESLSGSGSYISQVSPLVSNPTTSQIKYGAGAGIALNGSSDFLKINKTSYLGTSAFTIEAWVYPLAYNVSVVSNQIWSAGNNGGFNLSINSSGYVNLSASDGVYNTFPTVVTGTTIVQTGVWSHIAVTKDSSNNLRVFVNGVLGGTATRSTALNLQSGVTLTETRIGSTLADGGNYDYFNGYISNLRVNNTTCIYNANFTPPTTTLTAVSGTVILMGTDGTTNDNSSSPGTITTNGSPVAFATSSNLGPFTVTTTANIPTTAGSAYFDGSGDYLLVPDNPALRMESGNFTIEFWLYYTSIAGYQTLFSKGYTAASDLLLQTGNGDGKMMVWISGSAAITEPSGAVTGQWYHYALVRNGTAVTLYRNGVSVGTATSSVNFNTTNQLGIGATGKAPAGGAVGDYPFFGYISDLRVVKGTAVYTTPFYPSVTTQLTNITNTKLLTLQTSGAHNNNIFIDNSNFNNVITRAGNATSGAFSPYGDNWSVYFSAANIDLPSTHTVFAAANEDFTIECWIYLTASAGTHSMICGWNASPWDYWEVTSSGMTLNLNNNYNMGCSYTFAIGTWYHVAGSRTSNSAKVFVNGVLQSTNTVTSSLGSGSVAVRLGNWYASPNYSFPGYISNFRFVKGTGLYTTSFTVSTSPLPYVAGTQLLACQSPRFVDNGPNNYALTLSGAPTIQKLSPFRTVTTDKYFSTSFNGTTDYLQVPTSTSLDLTSDFTIECWIYPTALSTNRIIIERWISGNAGGWELYWRGTGTSLTFYVGASVIMQDPSASTISTLNTWYHVAVTRSGTNAYMFINGTQVATASSFSTSLSSSLPLTIGNQYSTSTNYFSGYISNLRILKGTALYTATFTPSTTPLTAVANTSLLTCQSNMVVDNSGNNLTVTGGTITVKPMMFSPFTSSASNPLSYSSSLLSGSMYFDGTGDYLSVSVPNSFNSSTSSGMTIEFWSYPTGVMTSGGFFGYGTTTNGYSLEIDASRWVLKNAAGTDRNVYVVAAATVAMPVIGVWTHYAVVFRPTGTVDMYINGLRNANLSGGTSVTSSISGGTFTIGSAYGNGYLHVGYIADFRVTTGVALYTSNFFPSTSPYQAIQTIGTSKYYSNLLVNGTSSAITDISRSVDVETVGDTKTINFSPYFGNYYSVYFDGTGDLIQVPNSANFAFGTGDFTIEFWINTTDTGGGLIGQAAVGGWAITIYTSTVYWQSSYNSVNLWTYSASTIIDGKWHHLAFSRASGSTKFFIDGALAANNSDSTNYTATSGTVTIGRDANPADLIGYISNLRVVKGTAIYTSAFTPSTNPLAVVTGTSLLTCQSNKFVDNSTNALTVTPSGNVKVDTLNPFQANTGIAYAFDGTGDYLSLPNYGVSTLTWWVGSFTLEFWIFPLAFSQGASQSDPVVIGVMSPSTSSNYWSFGPISNGTVKWYYYNGAQQTLTTSAALTLGQWTHLAFVQTGGNMAIYINGVSSATGAVSGTPQILGSVPLTIGSTSGVSFNGYLSDVRIAKGARYTGAFTPSSAPFTSK